MPLHRQQQRTSWTRPPLLPTKQLKRGLALMGEAKWIQALEFFEAQAANTPTNAEPTAPLPSIQPNPNSSPDTQPVVSGGSSKSKKSSEVVVAACIALCKAKLGFAPPPAPRSLLRVPAMPSSGGKPASAWPDTLQHLSKAVSAAAQAKSGQGGRQQPGQSAAVVVGEALACLLHPGTPAWLPAPLQQLAQGLLSEQAATFAATGPMLAAVASAFDRLGPEFLADLQGALEQQGHDLSNEALVQRLAGDGSLPDALLPLLARSAGSARDLGMLREMVRQWQRAVQQQMELQRKLAKKGKRPVWRCAVCGRYGCPFRPYIERYEEFDLP